MSPGEALEVERMYRDTDVRHILPVIQAPTMVIHGTDDPVESIEEARWIASQIQGTYLIEFAGDFHWWPRALVEASAELIDSSAPCGTWRQSSSGPLPR